MLSIRDKALDDVSLNFLAHIQQRIDSGADYSRRVSAARLEWARKTSTIEGKTIFRSIRETLGEMCIGSVRCAYCEDSAADEIEHIKPKNFFPEFSFDWSNFLFSCGICNVLKSDQYGVIYNNSVILHKQPRNGPIVPPPAGQSAFIDPRNEDPLDFLELDLGGTTPEGTILEGTFELLAREDLSPLDKVRAEFTIKVLGLNRELIRKSRENAFGGFRARISEYVQTKEAGATEAVLEQLRKGILNAPHLSVFVDMRRQKNLLPEIARFIELAPEIDNWNVIPD